MPGIEIVAFSDEHLEGAAALLARRHERHREAEPLLPEHVDFRAQIETEWHADGASGVFASRDGEAVGYLVARPADLRAPADSIDLANAATFPELRGTGVGRALTAHVIRWAHDNGYQTLTTDWRLTNLLASRFWPKRGFRVSFLRLYRSIP
jgi:GNAT superfamily N-acetyltransferase